MRRPATTALPRCRRSGVVPRRRGLCGRAGLADYLVGLRARLWLHPAPFTGGAAPPVGDRLCPGGDSIYRSMAVKSVVLTGINGTVAQALERQMADRYDVSGISIVRMDDVLRDCRPTSWKEQLDMYRDRVTDQLATAIRGKDVIAHLGWNTRDEHCHGGLDPMNILVVDCVYRAAIAEKVPRIYLASSVHAYDFMPVYQEDVDPLEPFPDVRVDPFGMPPTSLYGVSKRWMEIAGQFYVRHLGPGQRILVVRLGGVDDSGRPHRPGSRLWDSHRDLAGLLEAFIECEDAPNYWVAYNVSDNHGGQFPRPLFSSVNPYGFVPIDNSSDPV